MRLTLAETGFGFVRFGWANHTTSYYSIYVVDWTPSAYTRVGYGVQRQYNGLHGRTQFASSNELFFRKFEKTQHSV
jgi:hypothetical protein